MNKIPKNTILLHCLQMQNWSHFVRKT